MPGLDAIAQDAKGLRYFKAVSDNVLGRDTWGVIAAVLGNSSNRYLFSQGFWRDEENGLSTYLNHACGIPQTVNEPQEDGPPRKRNRSIIDRECPPPGPREALKNWEAARSHFIARLKEAEVTRARLQDVHTQIVRLRSIYGTLEEITAQLLVLEREAPELEARALTANSHYERDSSSLQSVRGCLLSHSRLRPGFFARLFGTSGFRDWKAKLQLNEADLRRAGDAERTSRTAAETAHLKLANNRTHLEKIRHQINSLQAERTRLEETLAASKASLGALIPDPTFFELPHADIQTASIWFGKAENLARDALFEAAIKLHRAFVDSAADPLRQNLSVFVESFGTRSLGTPEKDELIGDLWASFFMVVPVVSTTFASVQRMFSRLKPEALGWLLIDEAGQALPQAAVGAMMRTKRSVVVGDPLQIEPVVTLPSTLTEEICGHFGINPMKYNAPEASVQTMADAASMYCARFPIGSGHRDVGAPLLVHRRCDSPMFEISNEIAYSNLMVQAKRPSPTNTTLGKSRWVDVAGKPGPDKWCADEAGVLIDMLSKLRSSGQEADLYIVTPFVIVQNNLRQELLKSGVLKDWVENPDSWVCEHVGTVHTVQGREAQIVFFVLGAQAVSQNGARAWAGGRPNLVNVAVTRAQSSLYVIGNRSLWKTAGVFSVLDRYL